MRSTLSALVALSLVAPTLAQEYPDLSYAWSWTGDHTGGDEVSVKVLDVAFGPDGSLHFCGYFKCDNESYKWMDFDPGPGQDLHTTDSSSQDMFCTKVYADGSFDFAAAYTALGLVVFEPLLEDS